MRSPKGKRSGPSAQDSQIGLLHEKGPIHNHEEIKSPSSDSPLTICIDLIFCK